MKRLTSSVLFVMLVAFLGVTRAQAAPVGLDLTLLVDVSGSVDASEFSLQRTGYVNAFNDPVLQNLIANSVGDGIAARLIYWSGTSEQQTAVNWTHITDAASASAFASAINAAGRPYSGNTAPGSAINYAFASPNSPWFGAGTRTVFDVSGDGAQNEGANTFNAATAAHSAGVTLNGLAILGEAGLQTWYQNNIVTPGGGFLVIANNFSDFDTAVRNKIQREVAPEPTSMVLLGLGLLGVAGRLRSRSK